MTILAKPKGPVAYRIASFSDFESIAALETRNGLTAKSKSEWEHLWRANPAYQKRPDWPTGWVLENSDGQIVGSFGNIPLSYEFQGRELLTVAGRGLVADPPYRGHATALIRRFITQKADLIINSSCNAASAPLHEALRFSRVPIGRWDRSTFWITNYRGFVNSFLRNKHLPAVLANALIPALWAKRKFGTTRPRIDCDLQTAANFDERFDDFWEESRRTNNHKLLANRSRANLSWHFHHALSRNAAWVVSTGSPSRLNAYAVFLRDDNPLYGLKRVRLIDFQERGGSTSTLESMLGVGLGQCENLGIHVLEAFGFSPEKQRVIERLAPWHRRLPSWLFYYRTRNSQLAADLKVPAAWDPCHFDGDASL